MAKNVPARQITLSRLVISEATITSQLSLTSDPTVRSDENGIPNPKWIPETLTNLVPS